LVFAEVPELAVFFAREPLALGLQAVFAVVSCSYILLVGSGIPTAFLLYSFP
jgi:hypothetical protein